MSGDIGRVDVEHQRDGQDGLDRAGDIHPGRGRIELGGLEEASVAGSVNLPTTWGMKNSAQIRRSSTIPLSRLNLSAHDMLSPVT